MFFMPNGVYYFFPVRLSCHPDKTCITWYVSTFYISKILNSFTFKIFKQGGIWPRLSYSYFLPLGKNKCFP